VRAEPQWAAVCGGDRVESDDAVQELFDEHRADRLLPRFVGPLDEERQGRAVHAFGAVVARDERDVVVAPRTRAMIAASASDSSGLTTSSRSRSVLDGVTCSRG
jgi:hypothetical protein